MTIKYIKETIERRTGCEIDDNTRERHKVYLRALYFYLSREYTIKSFEEIGKLVNRDHSTAVYGVKLFEQAYSYEYSIRQLYDEFVSEHPNKAKKVKVKTKDLISDLKKQIEQLQIENTRLMLDLEQAHRLNTIEV